MLKFKLVELSSEHACTGAYSIKLRGPCAPGPCFLSQDLWVQLDDCTHLNSELKEQVAMAQRCNSLLQSQLEELRSLQEQTECGCRQVEEELLEATERIHLFHTQVGPINSSHYLHQLVKGSGLHTAVSLRPCTVAMLTLGVACEAQGEPLASEQWSHSLFIPQCMSFLALL